MIRVLGQVNQTLPNNWICQCHIPLWLATKQSKQRYTCSLHGFAPRCFKGIACHMLKSRWIWWSRGLSRVSCLSWLTTRGSLYLDLKSGCVFGDVGFALINAPVKVYIMRPIRPTGGCWFALMLGKAQNLGWRSNKYKTQLAFTWNLLYTFGSRSVEQ